ncbi:hypothetical protein [Streptomyces hainanensis]|uniref:EamA/RhaT family transporter n=1 Tax=Streptomyces hainanensis TaxID=402648 RepID=A0A4R4SYU0_9ACTN|nr:hypothetical protein [Streptomyces hainanensis]TDC68456.1 hypothetical protein E1283_27400 [Streptomyces hainanensis]
MSTSAAHAPDPSVADEENAPRPEPIRFYGTRWVDRSGGYALRRVLLTGAAGLGAVTGALALWILYAGVADGSPTWLGSLVLLALLLCTAIAFTRAWVGYTRPRSPDAIEESAFRSIKVVGFVGVLLAYGLRGTIEAPGEGLRRADYQAAVARHRRLTGKRSGNPARRRGSRRR